jgi:hypothetical protein
VLGSVRTTAGDNRLSIRASQYQEAGCSGVVLRRECIPGYHPRIDLEIVGAFWNACINDLKSTRSKSFSFRAKNNMEKSAATNWVNYQKNVLSSGALGDPGDSVSMVDTANGDYKGFA